MIISKIGRCALAVLHLASAAPLVHRGRISGGGGGGGGGGGDDPHRLRALQGETAPPTTASPSTKPTSAPPTTRRPTNVPSTARPTSVPSTRTPTNVPTRRPTRRPSQFPTSRRPTEFPTTRTPTNSPTSRPTEFPTTRTPTNSPTFRPSGAPTNRPTSVPTNQPTSRPSTDRPTSRPTNQPTMSPTTAAPTTPTPTSTPTRKPTNSPVLPYDNPVLTCPLPGATMIVITPGVKQVSPAPADTFCGIFLRKGSESGSIIPLARSYHGRGWEAAPGPLACPAENINATTVVLPELQDADDRYVILAKDGSLSERKQIARFLEMTTFGPRRSEIDAIAADGTWTTGGGAAKRAAYLRNQIDLPKTSHREYYRRRANAKWDATSQPARSDHPCSPNSKWRKYSYIQQDRLNTNTEAFVVTTFETVKAEENLTTTIYEADNATQVSTPGFGMFWTAAATATTYGYSGKGFYDMAGTNDFVQFTVNVPTAGLYPISFRYSQGSSNYAGNRKMQLHVNGVLVRPSYDFFFTFNWSFWKYSELVDVSLNAGVNTIKLLVVDQNGGPNIDHLRVGKPPAIVLRTNGWPRAIARNGLHLVDGWPFQFTNTTQVHFQTNNPDAPQGGLFRYPNGRLRVLLPNGDEKFLDIGNPPINFTGYEQYLPQNVFTFDGSEIWDETASDLFNYPMMRGQELLLRHGFNGAICDLIPPFAEEYDAPIFGKLPSGEWLQWTPTIQLEDNGPSINDPRGNRTAKVLVDGGGEAFVATDEKLKCSNVQRSFINEDTCFLSTLSTACSATNPVGEVIMNMNTTLVLDLFDLTGREVYAIEGLVMESRMESPCAKTRSRWVVERGATCPAPSVLGANTTTVLRNAIISSTDSNQYAIDVDRPRTALCNADDWDQDSDPIHIQLQVGPDCYTHVHPDHLNVYDFTGWVTNHPGGSYHIQKWSQGWEGHPGWYLIFPFYGNATRKITVHPMNRWVTKAKEPDIVQVGRLGDNIAFRDLPSELKVDAVAAYFGATPKSVTDGGVVVCGSMGEVSNDPSFAEVFDVRSNLVTVSSSDTMNNQKSVVWTEVALYGDDQLRQRMAWALAQIITTVPANINAYDNTEIYTHYYDIFVKHAFGNFRDILGEISYSPLMAEHLSYLKSKSHSYVYEFEKKRIARADENFAREVMQLFSIGLIVLNDDGSWVLDPVTGNPLETYTNEDVESLARAWTGFDRTAVRGNYEEAFTGTADNRMDPMQIVPDYRDPFPKSNLDGGFIGDGYVLCSDLPAQSFLKKGAGYRLLGGTPSPDLMKDPSFFTSTTPGEILKAELNPSSQLYQTLYNSGKLLVTLENDLVCTPGTFECFVDTLRIVKVGSVYYEFVERPCVQLGFYNNGKQIQLRDNWRRGQMCANADLAHAREACCREVRVDEVSVAVMVSNVTYFYDGERMTYNKARDRCVAYGRDLCFYESLVANPTDDSRKKGYHWTNKDCAINVKVNSEGYIAIVHDATSTQTDTIPWLVEETNTLNWFRVSWDGDGDYPGSSETNTCEANNCKVVVTDDGSCCLCKTIVTDSVVFTDTNISKESVMSKLFIGALGPQAGSVPTSLGIGLTAHIAGGFIDGDTVFEVQDKGRTMYLKNTLSTVNLEGWTIVPRIYEAEAATISNAQVKNDTKTATGQKYVGVRGNETTYIEWNVNVSNAGEYLLSLRYAHETSPRPLSVYVNTQLVARPPTNPNNLRPFANIGNDPAAAQLPLQRCAGDCDTDAHCMPGLFCMQNTGLERVPGCNGTQAIYDYCVDINDFDYGFTLLSSGGWTDDWQISKPLKVNLNAGKNLIRVQLPPRYTEGPNIDHLKVEGLPVSSSSSFRNPPHFMSLIPDNGSGRIGERNLRDAQYETEAVLDHYFYQDNVAPFICVRIMQRFSFSNPSPRFISSCVEAFRSGLYTSEATTFGSGKYGSLEAVAASILLDSEAIEGAIAVDPSYGSMREPILKLLNLMRSMDYRTSLPTPIDGALIQTTYNVKLWRVDKKIGHGPYEFPSVFSFFLPHYLPVSGPNLPAKLVSPESIVVTMPNIIGLLNGMFSLIKYGLTDCNEGFSLFSGYGSCLDDGLYQRSFGHLFYTPSGANDHARGDDLAQLLTAGRLSRDNLDKIVVACSTEPNQESKDRCMMQLIVTTGEFHSTNTVTQSGEDRVIDTTSVNSTEPYKAIVYFFLSGGLDSYHMLAPHTCAPIDVYERYRSVRGKSDIAEGVGLPLTRLLEIPANNAAQPCSSFGINENLPVLKTLYDQEDLIFIANAGLLAKPVDVTNYYAETPVQLFAHDAMILEASREDLYDEFAGTGVGGRMAQVLTNAGIPTNMFSIYGQQTLLSGEPGSASSQFILSSSGLSSFNAEPSIANMINVIKALNNDNTADSGFHAEAWSSKVAESMDRHKELKERVDMTNVTTLFPADDIANQFKLVTRLMQTRDSRGSKRDIFYVQDGGYDTHASVDESLIINFGRINSAIQAFVAELKVLNLWNSTTVVQFSDFSRTLNPNTGDGSDHGWGGHHFMFGGEVRGGKVLGRYPNDFNQGEGNNLALSRGRMIPEFPWDSMWLGTAEWFGIPPNSPGMDRVLPMHKNFASSLLYRKADLFNEVVPTAMSQQSAPMPSAFVDNPTELVVNTAMRCGISEVDAREHCRTTCMTSSDCPFTMTCFSVHENYCGSIPQRIYVNPEVSVGMHRCGTSEIHSRTFCGAPCEWSEDCTGGETCHGVHANYCGSLYTEMAT